MPSPQPSICQALCILRSSPRASHPERSQVCPSSHSDLTSQTSTDPLTFQEQWYSLELDLCDDPSPVAPRHSPHGPNAQIRHGHADRRPFLPLPKGAQRQEPRRGGETGPREANEGPQAANDRHFTWQRSVIGHFELSNTLKRHLFFLCRLLAQTDGARVRSPEGVCC